MDPVTALVAGTAISGVGSLASGISQSSQLSQQSDVLSRNAAMSEQQAGQVYAQGVERESQQRAQSDQTLGTQRAAVAESGFNPSTGSALDVQVQSTQNAELDALQTRYQGILQGSSLEDQAAQQRYQSKVAAASSKTALATGVLSVAGSALSGYAAYSKFGALNPAGSNAYGFKMPQ